MRLNLRLRGWWFKMTTVALQASPELLAFLGSHLRPTLSHAAPPRCAVGRPAKKALTEKQPTQAQKAYRLELLPAAAECLIQANQIRGCVALAAHELVFRRIERCLRFKHREEITDSVRVELIGQVDRLLACFRRHHQCLLTFLLAFTGDEGILDFFERLKDHLMISDHSLLLACLLYLDVGSQTAAIEDGQETRLGQMRKSC